MSVLQYPQYGYFLIKETSANLEMGSVDVVSAGYLRHITLRVFHKKTGSYSFTMRLKISTSAGGPALAYSDYETFSDTETGQATSDWLGNLTFTFDGYPISTSIPIFVSLETVSYTRTANTAYLGVWCDWFEPIGATNTAAARMILGVEQ